MKRVERQARVKDTRKNILQRAQVRKIEKHIQILTRKEQNHTHIHTQIKIGKRHEHFVREDDIQVEN